MCYAVLFKFNYLFGIIRKGVELRIRRTLNISWFRLDIRPNHSADLKRAAQFYENDGQLRHHMVKHFLEEDIQTKINDVSLWVVGDGETLERGLECLRKTNK